MLRVGLCWWWLVVVGRLYRIRYQGDQWGSSLRWAQTAYLVWKCILTLIILKSVPVTLWLKKKQFHILPMMIHFLCGAIAAQVATHLWSGEGERRGGNKYFPIFKKIFGRFSEIHRPTHTNCDSKLFYNITHSPDLHYSPSNQLLLLVSW